MDDEGIAKNVEALNQIGIKATKRDVRHLAPRRDLRRSGWRVGAPSPSPGSPSVSSCAASPLAVLDKISLDCPPGSFTALIGPSGCGKSTLLGSPSGSRASTAAGCAIGDETPEAVRRARRDRHRLPGSGAPPLALGRRQHRPAARRARRRPARRAGADRASHRAGRAGRVRAGAPRGALRRHAPAGRDRPLAGDRAGRAPDGRAVRRARPHPPPPDEPRAAAHLDGTPADHRSSSPTASTRRSSSPTASWCSAAGRDGSSASSTVAFERPRPTAIFRDATFHRLTDRVGELLGGEGA